MGIDVINSQLKHEQFLFKLCYLKNCCFHINYGTKLIVRIPNRFHYS